MLNQEEAQVFPEVDPIEQPIGEDIDTLTARLNGILGTLDAMYRKSETVDKEAALAEYLNMKKMAAYKAGDLGYEVTDAAQESTSCRYCGRLSRSGFCYTCNC
jgi:hypothetical protein